MIAEIAESFGGSLREIYQCPIQTRLSGEQKFVLNSNQFEMEFLT